MGTNKSTIEIKVSFIEGVLISELICTWLVNRVAFDEFLTVKNSWRNCPITLKK